MAILNSLFRLKKIEKNPTSQLNRCIGLFDLTALGIGSTLGLGIYVLIGEVAAKTGPSIIIAFFVAGLASAFAGLCYAEFAAKVPKAGSAYVYSYVTVGELVAFIIGWNLILEYAIGTSSVAKGYSVYLDSLLGNSTRNFFDTILPSDSSSENYCNITCMLYTFSHYFDIVAFGMTMLVTIILCFGVKESTLFNSVFTVLNVGIVIFVVCVGSFNSDWSNWSISKDEAAQHHGGNGGFLPFGISGLLQASASCFYFFVGFDIVATSSEEAKNPSKTIPMAIILCLSVVFVAYSCVSTVQTLMEPYYSSLILPEVFASKEIYYAKWFVVIGGLAGLSASLIGAIYPLPRVLYSMSSDGLIFRFLSKVSKKTKVPIRGTLISGGLAGFIAAVFNLKELADMMSIGTLLAYTLVALSVTILRYRKNTSESTTTISHSNNASEEDLLADEEKVGLYSLYSFHNLFNREGAREPTNKSSYISSALILILTINVILFDGAINFQLEQLQNGNLFAYTITIIVFLLFLFFFLALSKQPMNAKGPSFEVPFLPLIPFLSVFCNVLLMFNLSTITWLRFVIWMILGFLIYFLYGIKNSSENSERIKFLSNNNYNKRIMEEGIVNESMTAY